MVKVKAYFEAALEVSEIRRFEIEAGTTFAQLQELVVKLSGLRKEDLMIIEVIINYFDKDGYVVWLSSDAELQIALKYLGEQDTWKLKILV